MTATPLSCCSSFDGVKRMSLRWRGPFVGRCFAWPQVCFGA